MVITPLASELEGLDEELWYRGDLSELFRPHKQTEIYRFLHRFSDDNPQSFGPVVLNCHRRLGKSFLLFAFLMERCLRYPNQVCRFVGPSYEQTWMYLTDIMNQIIPWMPKALQPKPSGDTLTFRNPALWGNDQQVSLLEIRGVVHDGDNLRGTRANIVALDEVREMKNPAYIVQDVLSYQFAYQFKPLLLISSSPPRSMAHPFVSKFIPEAKGRKLYFLAPAEDTPEAEGNKDFTEDDKRQILDSCAGDSVSYRREALCELISDPEALIIPEFAALKGQLVYHEEQPEWFDAYMAVDFGFQDHNGALFAYVNFLKRRLHFRSEVWLHNVSTGTLAVAMRATEERLWTATKKEGLHEDHAGRFWQYRDLIRVGDHSKQQLVDLSHDHDFHVLAADKWDFEAALANFRHGIASGRVSVDPECENFIHQLEHGTWKESADGSRRTFTRDAVLGHCDLIAAANYLYRRVAWDANPFPPERPNHATTFFLPEDEEEETIRLKPLKLKFRPIQ